MAMKPKKLRFKKLKKTTTRFRKTLKIGDVELHSYDASKANVVEEIGSVQDEILRNFERTKKCIVPAIKEFGDCVDGYRFVAFDESQILMEDKQELSDSSRSSCEDEKTDDEQIDENIDKLTFSAYNTKWKLFLQGLKVRSIPLPVATGKYEDVNVENVKLFLKCLNNAKKERIRWHPDKMRTILKEHQCGNLLLDNQITHIFQIINIVYETWNE